MHLKKMPQVNISMADQHLIYVRKLLTSLMRGSNQNMLTWPMPKKTMVW